MSEKNRAQIVALPEYREDGRGALVVAACGEQVPFVVRRSFIIYDVPVGITRGGHAHQHCQQFLICMAGALNLEATDAAGTASFHLSGPTKGLYVPTLTWLSITPVAAGTVVLALVSDDYDKTDYIRDWADFEALIAGGC